MIEEVRLRVQMLEARRERVPEKHLLVEILKRALSDVGVIFDGVKGPTRDGKINPEDQRDAFNWLMSEETKPFSFRWVVDHCYPSFDTDGLVSLFRYRIFH